MITERGIFMKRSVKSILCGIVISAVMSVCALGAQQGAVIADKLNSLGLFRGTTTGYQLDRAPTRAESAAMLVRLLGAEKEATDKNYAHPYTDVPEWASPYVGYMHENGLTNGIGSGKFGSSLLCSRQMYCTFALRALGYSDSGNADFKYADAISFAQGKGLPADSSAEFLRRDVVLMSYQALATDIKGSSVCLLQSLADRGAVSGSAYTEFADSLAGYKKYTAAMNSLADKAKQGAAYDVSASIKAKSNAGGVSLSDVSAESSCSYRYLPNGGNTMLSYTVSENGAQSGVFVKDGAVYTTRDGKTSKLAAAQAQPQIDTILSEINSVSDAYRGFYNFDSISASQDKIILRLNPDTMSDSIISMLTWSADGASLSNIQVKELIETITLGSNGLPVSQTANAVITANIGNGGTSASAEFTVSVKSTVTAVGSGVSVEYPELPA